MFIQEFRIPLPMEVNEFQTAQLYMVMKTSEQETGGGEGVEILKNEPYDNTDGHMGVSALTGWPVPKNKGQYTLKHYYIGSKLPSFLVSVVPRESTVLIEEAWNAYPHCVTVICNGYLSKDKFRICIESNHLADRGETENALNLSPEELKKRKVEIIDIAKPLPKKDMIEGVDPSTYHSLKTERGPLQEKWMENTKPIMTCYKVVRAYFAYWGLQGKVESMLLRQQRSLFTGTLRQCFCLTDEWFGLSMEEIRKLEAEAKEKLDRERATGAIVQSKFTGN